MASDSTVHYVELTEHGDGFWHAACACGWVSSPVPGADDAADAYGDHRVEEEV